MRIGGREMASIVGFKEIPLGDLTIGLGQVRIRDVSKDILITHKFQSKLATG